MASQITGEADLGGNQIKRQQTAFKRLLKVHFQRITVLKEKTGAEKLGVCLKEKHSESMLAFLLGFLQRNPIFS